MREIFRDLYSFLYSLSLGDYFFYIGTFLVIVLFIYVIYLLKCSEYENNNQKQDNLEDDILDLLTISEKIETEYKPGKIELTGYEEEQENNAIISYEELVKSKGTTGLNYDDEFIYEEPTLKVKKVDLTNRDINLPDTKLSVKLMSYDKEEAFLKALKQLQKDLTN